MDRNSDFPPFYSYTPGFDSQTDDIYSNPMFNPIVQYEQAYMYYKYMCKQLEYKMKLKEYEKLSKQDLKTERRVE